jgi:hypothetical protein
MGISLRQGAHQVAQKFRSTTLPAPVRQPVLPAFGVGEGGVARRLRFGGEDELLHVALAQRFERGGVGLGRVCEESHRRVEERGAELSGNPDHDRHDLERDVGRALRLGPDAIMEAINASIGFDKRLARRTSREPRPCRMLAATGIVSDSDAEAIREGLLTVLSEIEAGTFAFSHRARGHPHERGGAAEGDHRRARRAAPHGAEPQRPGGDRLPPLGARAAATRRWRGLEALHARAADQAEAGADWVMPGFTHLQTAQPVTWGHHMMAYVEMLGRDARPLPRRPGADERMPAGRGGAGRAPPSRSTGT